MFFQARVIAQQAVKSLGDPKGWSKENVSNAANILRGFKSKELAKLPAGSLAQSLRKINKVRFSKDQVKNVLTIIIIIIIIIIIMIMIMIIIIIIKIF